MYTPIKDYAIIGNLRSAALVSKHGSIDWAPVPYLDSPSVFASILDEKKGGHWQIAPVDKYQVVQEYQQHTNIVITHFKTKTGAVDLIDFIPIVDQRYRRLHKENEPMLGLYRKIVCTAGTVDMAVTFSPRFNYARGKTVLKKVKHGVSAEHESGQWYAIMLSTRDFVVKEKTATVRLQLKKGAEHVFLYHNHRHKIPGDTHQRFKMKLRKTKKFWDDWAHKCDLGFCQNIPFSHDRVMRSSLVLKILFFDPPGTIAAAPTTSLPESIGGVRNWDYRFLWLRDSAFVLRALFRLGHAQEAEKYVKWLVDGCCAVARDNPAHLQIMYGLQGQHELTEEILPHLEGYKKSKPVRIGNGAYTQKQWDVYGGVIDTIWQLHKLKGHGVCDKRTWGMVRSLANYVVKIWEKPDECAAAKQILYIPR